MPPPPRRRRTSSSIQPGDRRRPGDLCAGHSPASAPRAYPRPVTSGRPAGTRARTDPEWVRLADGALLEPAERRPMTARRVLARFVVGNLVAVAVLMVGIVWASRRAAE